MKGTENDKTLPTPVSTSLMIINIDTSY